MNVCVSNASDEWIVVLFLFDGIEENGGDA